MKIVPVKLTEIDKYAANLYEGVIVASKRARQINDDNRIEFNTQINTLFGGIEDEFEEKENPDRLRVSLQYEKKTKPHIEALNELIDGKIEFYYKDQEKSAE